MYVRSDHHDGSSIARMGNTREDIKSTGIFWSFFGSFSIAFITFEVFWQDKAQMSFLETLIMLIAVGLFCGLFSIISLKKETQSPKTPTDT